MMKYFLINITLAFFYLWAQPVAAQPAELWGYSFSQVLDSLKNSDFYFTEIKENIFIAGQIDNTTITYFFEKVYKDQTILRIIESKTTAINKKYAIFIYDNYMNYLYNIKSKPVDFYEDGSEKRVTAILDHKIYRLHYRKYPDSAQEILFSIKWSDEVWHPYDSENSGGEDE